MSEPNVYRDIVEERRRQDAKWGEQNHDPFCWLTVLMEEVGEAAQAALAMRFDDEAPGDAPAYGAAAYRAELVQVAAVALAMVECLDRNTWWWGRQNAPRAGGAMPHDR